MEDTDCEHCAYLEAVNSDLEAQNEEYESEISNLRHVIEQIADLADDC